jgi:hypothetical protein
MRAAPTVPPHWRQERRWREGPRAATAGQGVFTLYAAGSGQAARDRLSDDDRNQNSVFTRVLVRR